MTYSILVQRPGCLAP